MSDIMAVFLNGIAQLEYDRGRQLPPQQALYLDKMDRKMDAGIEIGDEIVTRPDEEQRARYVAANLVHAIKTDNEAMAAAMCSYLALRRPGLKQLRIEESEDGISIEFDYDNEYRKQVAVEFRAH